MDASNLRARAPLLLGLIPIFVYLFAYSVTWSFIWDEGFHILAAQLIASGERPYLDFCFPQTPLNAYLNAGILLLFGHGWKPIHVVAALYLCGTVWLVADFVYTRVPDARWRNPCALAAAVLFGLNVMVVEFGPAAQAYPIGMLMLTASFRSAIAATESKRSWLALLSGFCGGFAAASTLLTAPILPLVLLWLWLAKPRLSKITAYLIGCAIPFFPVVWLYSRGPQQTWFNIVQYQAIFRRVNWGDVNMRDIDAFSSLFASPSGLLLLGLGSAAVVYLWKVRLTGWTTISRQFWLALACAVVLTGFIATAHPTFERYFCVAVPFYAILGGLGVYAAGSRLTSPRHAWLSGGLIVSLGAAIIARDTFDQRDAEHWSDYEEVAAQVAKVSPIGGDLWADELVYFLLDRTPPEGMAFSYAHRLDLPADQEKLYHIISQTELEQQVKDGRFQTFQTCKDSILDDYEPEKYFKRHFDPADCDVFTDPKASSKSNSKN